MRTWDANTHMTKSQWRAVCQRLQNRLSNMKVDEVVPKRGKPGRAGMKDTRRPQPE
jgi:hypothetical protein